MPTEKTPDNPPEKKLTALQEKFCKHYIKDFNATQAAIRAGYKERSAYSIGSENLRKPEIKARIEELLEEATLSAPETIKSISDIARTDIKDYFRIRKSVHQPKVSISLADYIERKKDELQKAGYVHEMALSEGVFGQGKALDAYNLGYNKMVRAARYELIQLEVRLAHEPNAIVIVDGPEELIEVADLDIARLVQDKDAGRIKSFANTEFGPKVEMYAADAALNTVAKYHGLLKEQVEHSGGLNVKTDVEIDYSKLPTEVLQALMAARVKTSE